MATTTTTTTSYNFLNLCRDVLVDEQTTMYWMIRRHLLASTMQCPKCSSACRIIARKGMFILLVPYLVNPAVQSKSMRRFTLITEYEPTESGLSSDTSSDDESREVQRMLTLSWLVI